MMIWQLLQVRKLRDTPLILVGAMAVAESMSQMTHSRQSGD
jgi:hypothetical protein